MGLALHPSPVFTPPPSWTVTIPSLCSLVFVSVMDSYFVVFSVPLCFVFTPLFSSCFLLLLVCYLGYLCYYGDSLTPSPCSPCYPVYLYPCACLVQGLCSWILVYSWCIFSLSQFSKNPAQQLISLVRVRGKLRGCAWYRTWYRYRTWYISY